MPVAGKHISVRHARHGRMGIGLPPAIARGRNTHEPGIEPVLHETHQHSVFNQRGAVGRRALIINAE